MTQPIPFNSETVTDPTIEKKIRFESLGQKFECTLQVPLYMWHALDGEAWDRAMQLVRNRADEIRREAALAGELLTWHSNMEKFCRQAVYNEFMKVQVGRGNEEGHEVPRDFA